MGRQDSNLRITEPKSGGLPLAYAPIRIKNMFDIFLAMINYAKSYRLEFVIFTSKCLKL